MNTSNYYWWFKSAIPPKICDDIVKYALQKKETIALTGDFDSNKKLTKKDVKNLQKKRKSDLVWLDEKWIYKEVPYVHAANRMAGWNFEWDRSESCQFTKYKHNQYYDWHCDSWDKPYNKPNTPEHGKIRKLSMTCQLTDGSEYEGGELEFDFRNKEKTQIIQAKQILSKGSIIVFPSFVWHRVKPVTKGIRYSLVMWNLGYPFK